MSYEYTVIVGHVGREPEMRYTPNGTAVTHFSVAVNRRYTDKNGQLQEKTKWFRVTTWGKLAEICNEHLAKGRLALIAGEVNASAFVGQDGEPKASLEITARDVKFLGGKNGSGNGAQAQADAAAASGPTPDADLPF